MNPRTRSLRWTSARTARRRGLPLLVAVGAALLLHALVMGAVPWGQGGGSEGGVRPITARQVVLAPRPAAAPPAVPPPATPPVQRRPPPPPPPPPPSERAATPSPPPEPPAAEPPAALPVPPDLAASAAEPAALAASAPPAGEEVQVAAAPQPAAEAASAAGGAPLPVYATRPAPAATLRYELRRGGLRGSGELLWQPRGDAYALSMRGTAFAMTVIEWTSEGGFDAAGIAPQRFTDRRRGRDARAANFQRGAGIISYSGPQVTYPLLPGSQDRVSWMLQLPAIIDAAPAVFVPGERVGLFVSGARGDADVWTFTVEGREAIELPAGRVEAALRLRREPRKPYDTRVEVWLDPARHHLPVRMRLSSVEGGEGNEFLLESMTLSP